MAGLFLVGLLTYAGLIWRIFRRHADTNGLWISIAIVHFMVIILFGGAYTFYEYSGGRAAVAKGRIIDVTNRSRENKMVRYSFVVEGDTSNYIDYDLLNDFLDQQPFIRRDPKPDSSELVGKPIFIEYLIKNPQEHRLDSEKHWETRPLYK